jgi:hypothetical protein
VGLDRARGLPLGAGLDHEAQDGEAHRMAEGPELLREVFHLAVHALFLLYSK